ncbi:MAG: hemolysin III family protein [Bacteroidia bacterium]|nr:hemolysin III family protein [Bacteroidia bacterium]
MSKTATVYDPQEERANIITHAIGTGLCLIGGVYLVSQAGASGVPVRIWGTLVFSVCLFLLYLASTLYHSTQDPVRRVRMRTLDHVSIYLQIAGSYTPFLLWFMESVWARNYLILMWSIALTGSVFKLFFTGKFRLVSTLAYLVMGWMVIFIGGPIFSGVQPETLWWLVAGGAAYTLGAVFYMWRKLRFHHAIWHVFTLIGSACHWWAVLLEV